MDKFINIGEAIVRFDNNCIFVDFHRSREKEERKTVRGSKREQQHRGSAFPRIINLHLDRPPSADRCTFLACVRVVIVRRRRRRCRLASGCSCAFVRAVTYPRVTEASRSRPRWRGTTAEDITITYLAALPLHSRLGARRTRTCARARVCESVLACVRAPPPLLLPRVCFPSRVSGSGA